MCKYSKLDPPKFHLKFLEICKSVEPLEMSKNDIKGNSVFDKIDKAEMEEDIEIEMKTNMFQEIYEIEEFIRSYYKIFEEIQ